MKLKTIKPFRSLYRFAVEGKGDFPLDMLRHDLCWPYDQHAVTLLKDGRGLRRVQLMSASMTLPAVERWRSFGWTATVEDL